MPERRCQKHSRLLPASLHNSPLFLNPLSSPRPATLLPARPPARPPPRHVANSYGFQGRQHGCQQPKNPLLGTLSKHLLLTGHQQLLFSLLRSWDFSICNQCVCKRERFTITAKPTPLSPTYSTPTQVLNNPLANFKG